MYNLLLLAIFCTAGGVLSSAISLPCKITDHVCLDQMANDIRPIVFAASPEYGIESSDPVFIKEIVAELPGFTFKLHDVSVSGISTCVNSNMKISDDISKAEYDLNCEEIKMVGKYEMSGTLLGIPAEGKGDYLLRTGKYLIHLIEEYSKDVKDGKTYISVTNFKLNGKALGPPKEYRLENLFNGDKDLAEALFKLVSESWKEIADTLQEPILYGIFDKIFSNANKYLKILPADAYIAF